MPSGHTLYIDSVHRLTTTSEEVSRCKAITLLCTYTATLHVLSSLHSTEAHIYYVQYVRFSNH